MGNSIKKKSVENENATSYVVNSRSDKNKNISFDIGTSQISLISFSKRFDLSFRGSQTQSLSLTSRRLPRKCNAEDSFNSSKTHWPVSNIESIFLPQFKIAENIVEKYTIQGKIAKGAFGKVYLVLKKNTDENYALKVISKSQVISGGSVLQLKAEVDIQSICGHHPFIVQCMSFWQSKKNIFLLSEYLSSGELFDRIKIFSFSLIQLYVAEIACAIDFLHNAGVIYRDLKPENILLDADYHIKLTDFGLSKWLKLGNRTRTICGTLQYMAPEILNGELYEHSVDWYALGVITYRMLTDKYPSINHSNVTVKNDSSKMPEDVKSKTCGLLMEDIKDLDARSKDLLIRLLEINPKFRLKSLLGLKRIAMFQHFNFDDIKHKKISPRSLIESTDNNQELQKLDAITKDEWLEFNE